MSVRRKKSKPTEQDPVTVVDVLEVDTQCLVCEAEFLDEDDLKIHVEQMHKQGLVLCRFCDAYLPGPEEFVTHFIRIHLDKVLFCSYCYRVFLNRIEHQQHEIRHCFISESRLSCSQCRKIFNRRQLQKHEYDKHKESDDGVMLNSFYSLLSSSLNMSATTFFDAVVKKEPFCCNMCNYYSQNIFDYVVHLQSLSCQSFVCDKCCKVFKKKRGLMTHCLSRRACHNAVSIKRKCPKCNKEFEPELFAEHKDVCEAEKCSTCGIIFLSLNALAEHRIKEHSIPQAISLDHCIFCKKEFVGEANLKKHIKRTHKDTSKYKYNCSHCGAIFMHPKKLFGHYYTRHRDIDPYTCKICNKTFRLRKKFTIHIKMEHKSVGYVEFDENLHVIFTDTKSEKPFQPEIPEGLYGDTEDAETAPQNDEEKAQENRQKDDGEQIESTQTQVTAGTREFNIEIDVTVESSQDTNVLETKDTQTVESKEKNVQDLKSTSNSEELNVQKRMSQRKQSETEKVTNRDKENKKTSLKCRRFRKRKGTRIKQPKTKRPKKSVDLTKESSDDEPLSNLRDTDQKILPKIKLNRKGMKYKTNKSKLTCNICSKYCYTYQNYHHHMSLHVKSKLKRCVKCLEFFKSDKDLQNHIESSHSSSKLTETLKSLLEKRKKTLTSTGGTSKQLPAKSLKQLIEERKKAAKEQAQNTLSNRFKRTIKKVDVSDREHHKTTTIITPMTDHGMSVKKFIENFRPDGSDNINISSSVTFKILNSPVEKQTPFKLIKMSTESPKTGDKLRWPVKFKDSAVDVKSNVSVKLVQELITKPKFLNFTIDERIPTIDPPPEKEYDEYCNTFADETDYTQYKNDATIPEVAQEVMLAADDIPRTKQLAQEIIIPNIPKEYGEVRIGHLLPQAPYYKIVKVKKLLKQETPPVEVEKKINLPDGTKLVTVNPLSHLIPNKHLEEVLKANRNKYYQPKVRNIESALVKALNNLKNPPSRSLEYAKRNKKKRELKAQSVVSIEITTESDSTESAEATGVGAMNESILT